jgi:hypothetical protein
MNHSPAHEAMTSFSDFAKVAATVTQKGRLAVLTADPGPCPSRSAQEPLSS